MLKDSKQLVLAQSGFKAVVPLKWLKTDLTETQLLL